jgi:hypothetical protein
MSDDRCKIIEAAIKLRDPSATDITFQLVVDRFLEGSVYYSEFKSQNIKPDETFFYSLVQKDNRVRLYDDGVDVIEGLQEILDKRRSFLQRLNEFSLVEMIGAVIAVLVTATFIYSVVMGQLSQELTGIFGIISGYYFGKNVTNRGS